MVICGNGRVVLLYGCVSSGLSIRISEYTILPTRERRTVISTVRTTMMAEVKALMAGPQNVRAQNHPTFFMKF